MVLGQYDLGSIRRAISDPDRALEEFQRLYELHVERHLYNELKYHTEKDASSQYGFVIHWNQYKQGRLGIAQTPFFVEAFVDEFDPVVLTTQRSYEYHKNHLDAIFMYMPGGRAPLIEFDSDQDHTICALLGDPHSDIERRENYVIQNDIEYVLTQYYSPFKRHFSRWDEYKLVHFPWAMPESFIIDADEISLDDRRLVVLGDAGGEPYETREWCSEFPFVSDPHRDTFANKTYSRGGYYEWLRNFDAVVAANSLSDDFRYVTAKFTEIPAAGALLFAQFSEDLSRMGFSEENCVIFTKDDFERKAKDYLDDPEAYLDRRRRGAELIAERHTISDRIQTIAELFDE